MCVDQHAADERIRTEALATELAQTVYESDRYLAAQVSRTITSTRGGGKGEGKAGARKYRRRVGGGGGGGAPVAFAREAMVMPAVIEDLSPSELSGLERHRQLLEQWGFTFTFAAELQSQTAGGGSGGSGGSRRRFGKGVRRRNGSGKELEEYDGAAEDDDEEEAIVVHIHSLPLIFGVRLSPGDLRSFVAELGSGPIVNGANIPAHRRPKPAAAMHVINYKACRGAIKFGDAITDEAAVRLVGRLALCMYPFQCAHGRPTVVPLADLSKA